MDRFKAQNYKIIERYASLIQYFLYLELIFVPLQCFSIMPPEWQAHPQRHLHPQRPENLSEVTPPLGTDPKHHNRNYNHLHKQ